MTSWVCFAILLDIGRVAFRRVWTLSSWPIAWFSCRFDYSFISQPVCRVLLSLARRDDPSRRPFPGPSMRQNPGRPDHRLLIAGARNCAPQELDQADRPRDLRPAYLRHVIPVACPPACCGTPLLILADRSLERTDHQSKLGSDQR